MFWASLKSTNSQGSGETFDISLDFNVNLVNSAPRVHAMPLTFGTFDKENNKTQAEAAILARLLVNRGHLCELS